MSVTARSLAWVALLAAVLAAAPLAFGAQVPAPVDDAADQAGEKAGSVAPDAPAAPAAPALPALPALPAAPEAPQEPDADEAAQDASEAEEQAEEDGEAQAEAKKSEAQSTAGGLQGLGAATLDATKAAADQQAAAVAATVDTTLRTLDREVIFPVQDKANGLSGDVNDALLGPEQPEGYETAGEPVAVDGPTIQIPDIAYVAAAATAAGAAVFFWIAGSSGSAAGAAGAGAGAKALGTDLRRLLPFASPLFTRFERDTVLGHPKREALYALILQEPGISLQALCGHTGLSRTAVAHHLRLLELQHLIVSKRHGRSRHYFENGGRFGREQKDAYAALQNPRSKQVARLIQDRPGAIQKELCERLGLQPSIVHWHVRRLRDAGLVEEVRGGRTVRYFPGPALGRVSLPVVPPAGAAGADGANAAAGPAPAAAATPAPAQASTPAPLVAPLAAAAVLPPVPI